MTGTCDITTCADVVYGKHFRTHLSQISLVSAKIISQVPIPGHTLLENDICYHDSDFTVVYSALQHGTNTSISEICAEYSVFSGTVTYINYGSIHNFLPILEPLTLL